jgi:DNA polymerase III subunit chi
MTPPPAHGGPAGGIVMFYHLTRATALQSLQAILPRAYAAGWRVLIRGPSAQLDALDGALWGGAEDSFLPHGLATGAAQDQDQPILLGNLPSNGFDALVLLGGADLDLAECAPLKRVWVLFDAGNDSDMTAARALWRAVSAAGLHAQYHSEETGKWALKTAVNAPAKPA